MALVGFEERTQTNAADQGGVYQQAFTVGDPSQSLIAPRAGVLKRLRTRVDSNSLDEDLIFELYLNGVATGLKTTYAATETGAKSEDATEVPVAQGDTISFVSDPTTSTSGTSKSSGSVDFE